MDIYTWTPDNITPLWTGQETDTVNLTVVVTSLDTTDIVTGITTTGETPTSITWSCDIDLPSDIHITTTGNTLHISGSFIGITPFDMLYLEEDFVTYNTYSTWDSLPDTNGEIIQFHPSSTNVRTANISITAHSLTLSQTKVYTIIVYSNYNTNAVILKQQITKRHKPLDT